MPENAKNDKKTSGLEVSADSDGEEVELHTKFAGPEELWLRLRQQLGEGAKVRVQVCHNQHNGPLQSRLPD